jgi:maltose alpha-D-glucosyltransferase/alpha-amylase
VPAPAPERLAELLAGKRWFAGSAAEAQAARLFDWIPADELEFFGFAIVETTHADGTRRHLAPVEAAPGVFRDVAWDARFASELGKRFAEDRPLAGRRGVVRFRATSDAAREVVAQSSQESVRPLGVEQSNSSIVFGERAILKLYRRLWPEENPELEMCRYLSGVTGFAETPALLGWFEYQPDAGGQAWTLAVMHAYEHSDGDAWKWATDDAKAFLEKGKPPDTGTAAELGRLTARLHNALGVNPQEVAFLPEPMSREEIDEVAEAARRNLARVLDRLHANPILGAPADSLLGAGNRLFEKIDRRAGSAKPVGVKIRTHGDYHLGQILRASRGCRIVDFEGEPSRPPAERRKKRSPLRDLAGLLRSFHYANMAALRGATDAESTVWYDKCSDSCVEAYLREIAPELVPEDGSKDWATVLRMFMLEKVVYELQYELDYRPDWFYIPVAGLWSTI